MQDGDKLNPARTLKEQEAAKYLGLSVAWLRQGRVKGRGHGPVFLRIGRAIRYQVEDLDAFLSSARVEPRVQCYTDSPLELMKR